jgi:hypothetical protein
MQDLPIGVQIAITLLYSLIYLSLLPIGFFLIIGISNYAQMLSPFLPETAPCDIPSSKYQRDLTILTTATEPIRTLGFEEYDRFYIGGSYRAIVIIYRHPEEPIQWYAFRLLGKSTALGVTTDFANDFTIETTQVRSAGKLPRRTGSYIQIITATRLQVLLTIHQDAIAIFREQRYEPQVPTEPRADILRTLQRQSILIRGFKFWPVRMSFWIMFRSNFRYRKTLREQIAAGTTNIPRRKRT